MPRVSSKLVPPTDYLVNNQKGTNDRLTGGTLYGDATVELRDASHGGNDVLKGTGVLVLVYGDAFSISGTSRGGNDAIYGADCSTTGVNDLFGDAWAMYNNTRGGDDFIKGGDFGNINNLYGDARQFASGVIGGNDKLIGGDFAGSNQLVGDAFFMSSGSRGGNDHIKGGEGTGQNFLFGEGEVLRGIGGNDFLKGMNNPSVAIAGENIIYGEAYQIETGAICGNDTLVGGYNVGHNTLYGDARFAYGEVVCGDDTLISGRGSPDEMWGDTQILDGVQISGADRFVFSPNNGVDSIHDFESGKDKLDLRAFGFNSVNDLHILHNPSGDMLIEFADGGSITLHRVSALLVSDYLLL